MILVTGATGLVGSHLLFQLAVRGENILAIKRRNSDLRFVKNIFSANPDLYDKVQWIEGDILDIASLKKALSGIQNVYHCAGMVSYDPADIDLMTEINIRGTEILVKLCIEYNIEKLCYVSSVSAINRINEKEIIDENTKWISSRENSNYAINKYKAEQIVWAGMIKGLKAVIVNPTIIIGPGNWKKGSTAIFQQIWKGQKFYTSGIAGFVDVRDVCEAMIRLMNSDIHSERYILNSQNLPYKKVFDWIAHYLNKPRPNIEANAFLLNIAWRLESVKKFLFKKSPFITRETVISGMKKLEFSNQKIHKAIDIKFIPVQQSIQDTCAIFLNNLK